MKTLYSNPHYVHKMAMLSRAKQLAMFPPAIPFEKLKKKKDEEEDDKDKYESFDIKLSVQEDDDSTVMCKVVVHSNGTPEEYCCWYKNCLDLVKELNIEEPHQEVSVLHTLLTDEALTLFEDKLSQCLPDNQDDLTDDIPKACIAKVALHTFSDNQNTYRCQVHHMRYNLYFSTTEVRSFKKRLKQLNQHLKYFPIPMGGDTVEPSPDDQSLESLILLSQSNTRRHYLKVIVKLPCQNIANSYLIWRQQLN